MINESWIEIWAEGSRQNRADRLFHCKYGIFRATYVAASLRVRQLACLHTRHKRNTTRASSSGSAAAAAGTPVAVCATVAGRTAAIATVEAGSVPALRHRGSKEDRGGRRRKKKKKEEEEEEEESFRKGTCNTWGIS